MTVRRSLDTDWNSFWTNNRMKGIKKMRDFIFTLILVALYIFMMFLSLLSIAAGIMMANQYFAVGDYVFGITYLLAGILMGIWLNPFVINNANPKVFGAIFTFVLWIPLGYLGIRLFWYYLERGIQSGTFEDIVISLLAGTFMLIYCTCGVAVVGGAINTVMNTIKKVNK